MTVDLACLDCVAAASGPHYGFTDRCKGCDARRVARGPDFYRVRKAQRLDAGYLVLLERAGVTHVEVKAAHAADAMRADGGHVPAAAIPSSADPA